MYKSIPKSFVVPSLVLVGGLVFVPVASAMSTMDWSLLPWAPGDRVHTYSLPADGVDLTIRISTTVPGPGPGIGTFASWDGISVPTSCVSVVAPNKDGTSAPGTHPTDRFGTHLDLGIVFDPAANSDQSVLIDLKFTDLGSGENGPAKAVATFKFEISDIDWSRGGNDCFQPEIQGWRKDQVVITGNDGANPVTAFTLTPLVAGADRTFDIGPSNVATAKGSATGGSESNTDDNGTLVVDFGPTFVTDVRITYNEAGFSNSGAVPNNNPGYRGIGILGGTTSLPVELMEFTIE